jgi:hypothetical protein
MNQINLFFFLQKEEIIFQTLNLDYAETQIITSRVHEIVSISTKNASNGITIIYGDGEPRQRRRPTHINTWVWS